MPSMQLSSRLEQRCLNIFREIIDFMNIISDFYSIKILEISHSSIRTVILILQGICL